MTAMDGACFSVLHGFRESAVVAPTADSKLQEAYGS